MEKSGKINKVKKTGATALFLVNLAAEMAPLLDDAGLGRKKGVVIFVERSADIGIVQKYFADMGAVMCKNLTSPKWVQNNKVGLHLFQLYDRETENLKFLAEDDFSPSVLVHSILPDYLRNAEALVVINHEIEFHPEIVEKFIEFQQYIHKSPEFVQKNIRLFVSSKNYFRYKQYGELGLKLKASAEVYTKYYRETHNEDATERLENEFNSIIDELIENSECYSGEWDNSDTIRSLVATYLEENSKVQIGNVNEIEGKLAEANQRGEAILWDGQFYYFPEKVLKSACKPILDVVSFLDIKRELQMKGYLRCQNITGGNFTVKKTITNAFGCKTRQRFLVIRKDFFDLDGELTLAERRGTPCVLELPVESPAE
jgi:hypothetical protein